jgi:conjugative relaxase-like TrwC/TraI family protein
VLSLHGLGAAAGGASRYYTDLARDDYYTQGGEPPGEWLGQGAAALGVAGAVDAPALQNVLRGFDGAGARALAQGAGDDHHAGWDLTFSAPKSVSVLWATTGDPTVRAAIQDAQRAAVAATVAFAERHCAFTRRGHDGMDRERVAGLAVATFEHATSREQDPQLHTHCLVANLAPRQDGTTGTLDGRHLYRWKMALGALYRAELAAQLQNRLPVQIGRDGSSFAIRGVPEAVQHHFSKRAEQVREWLAAHGAEGAQAAAAATLSTRAHKPDIDRPALFDRWQADGRALGWGPEQAAQLLERSAWARDRLAEPALADVREGLVKRQSTFAERDAWRALAEGMQGAGGIRDIEARMDAFRRDPEVVRLGEDRRGEMRWSTESMRQLEAIALARAEIGAEDRSHALSPAQIEPVLQSRPHLSAEQVEAVRYLCERGGAVATVEGLPGTGKSLLLDTARTAWEAAGYRVVGAALSGKAALGLQESAGIPSATLHARLKAWAPEPGATAGQPDGGGALPIVNDGMRFDRGGRPAAGALDAHTVVVVDEAGMVDSRKLAALIEATREAGAKLVLVGDHRQWQPVEAGGLFRALAERLETASLTEIRRQAEPWARAAVHAVAEGRAGAALQAYEERGLLHVGETKAEAIRALVSAWAEAGQQNPHDSRLMLAGERADVRALNHQAREHLRQTGHLGQWQMIDTAHGPRAFAVGDRVVCTRNSTPYGVRNGQLGTLEGIESRREGALLRVRLDEGGRVATLPTARYDHLDHGYALTAHKAQGATVDHAFVLAGGKLADRELGLVQLSRHRREARVFVDRSYYEAQRLEHGPDRAARREPDPPAPSERIAEPAAPEPVAQLDHAAAVRETLAALAAQLETSRQKDTTQDYQPDRGPSRGQGLE